MTLPIHQRKGYGNYLIDFSYLLSKKEGRIGSPEKPLSDLGLLSYRNYWKNVVFEEMRNLIAIGVDNISVEELSNRTSMSADDIITTLQQNNMIHRDPDTSELHLQVELAAIEDYLAKMYSKGYPRLKPDNLTWSPFVLVRGLVKLEKEEAGEGERVDVEVVTEGSSKSDEEDKDGDEKEND